MRFLNIFVSRIKSVFQESYFHNLSRLNPRLFWVRKKRELVSLNKISDCLIFNLGSPRKTRKAET